MSNVQCLKTCIILNVSNNVQTREIHRFTQSNCTFHVVACHSNFQEKFREGGGKLANETIRNVNKTKT